MIIDTCTFDGEWDILELRLRILEGYVDHFIVVEGNKTHSGNPRPQTNIDLDRFKWIEDKLHFYRATLNAATAWGRENEQRNAILSMLVVVPEDTLMILSDVDEIPSHLAINYARGESILPRVCHQSFFYYNMHNLRIETWCGSIFSTLKQMREITPQGLRDKRCSWPGIPEGGWHFSYFGGRDRIRQKLVSFAHQEYNTEQYLNASHVQSCINTGADLFNRGTQVQRVGEEFFPQYVVTEAKKLHLL